MLGADHAPVMPGVQATIIRIQRKGAVMVRARFWVQRFEKSVSGSAAPGQKVQTTAKVGLAPVMRKTDDNIEWSRYTPSGSIEMYVTQEGAQDWFEQRLGQDIAITFDDIS